MKGVLAYCNTLCQINRAFGDQRTRDVLDLLASVSFGAKVVEFLLRYVAYWVETLAENGLIFTGDDFVQWGNVGDAGAINDGMVITLDASSVVGSGSGYNSSDLATQAENLTHEAVEVYFSQADGVPGNTLPMDYLANWEAGEVQGELGLGNAPSSYGMPYRDWLAGDGLVFRTKYHESSNPGTQNSFLWFTWSKCDCNFLGDPMGLHLPVLCGRGKKHRRMRGKEGREMTNRIEIAQAPAPLEAYAQHFDPLFGKSNQREGCQLTRIVVTEANKCVSTTKNAQVLNTFWGFGSPRVASAQRFVSLAVPGF